MNFPLIPLSPISEYPLISAIVALSLPTIADAIVHAAPQLFDWTSGLARAARKLVGKARPTPAANQDELIEDILDQRPDVVHAIASGKFDLNTPDSHGVYPLEAAIRSDSPTMVTLLLNKGAWIKQPLKNGQTPVKLAYQLGHLDVFKAILDHNKETATRLLKELVAETPNMRREKPDFHDALSKNHHVPREESTPIHEKRPEMLHGFHQTREKPADDHHQPRDHAPGIHQKREDTASAKPQGMSTRRTKRIEL